MADAVGVLGEPLLRDLFRFARGRAAALLSLALAGAVLEGAGLVLLIPMVEIVLGDDQGPSARLTAPAFEALGIATTGGRLAALLLLFGAIIGVRFLVLLRRDVALVRLQRAFLQHMRAGLFERLAAAPWDRLAPLSRSRAGHALIADLDRIAGTADLALRGTVAAVLLGVQGALALLLSPAMTAAAGLGGLLAFRALAPLRRRARRRGEALTRTGRDVYETASGFLAGLKPAKAHGLEARYLDAFAAAEARLADSHVALARDMSLARLLLQSLLAVVGAGALVVGHFGLGMAPGPLVAVIAILARLAGPIQMLQGAVQAVRHTAPAYRNAVEAVGADATGGAAEGATPAVPAPAAPEIAFRGVAWRPGPAAHAVVAGLDLTLPAGRVTAVLGPSGAGKSTLCDLAVGLLTPSEGAVLADGAPLAGPVRARLVAGLAYVGQEPFLPESTLREALLWGARARDDASIRVALATVGAEALVDALPRGLDTAIRAEGTRFSGGERQRLRLARALLRRPSFLVLDEATNALDPAAERAVLSGVLAAVRGATVLMVSHRAEARALADGTVALEGGRPVDPDQTIE